LRRNQAYRKCCESGGAGPMAKLFRDFGDVRPDDFKAWWRQTGEHLFSEPPVPTSIQIAGDVTKLSDLDLRGCIVVVAPLALNKRTLKKRFGELLRKHHKGRRGGNRFRMSLASYPLSEKPVVLTLEKTLRVYDLWKTHWPEWPLWRIGEAAKVYEKQRTEPSDAIKDLQDKRRRMAIVVSRFLKHAKAYIENAGKGQFPKK
jgi:hypothetical protein